MSNQRKLCATFGDAHRYVATGKQVTKKGVRYAEEKCECGVTREIPVQSTSVQDPPRQPGGPQPIGK